MKYFAYGSNMDPKQMKKRRVNFLKREYAILEKWRLEFNKVSSQNNNKGYANILKDEEGFVEGILYEIQDSDIEKLDEYEGYPNHYERKKLRVKMNNGKEIEAMVYIAKSNKLKKGLKPSRKYIYHLLKGCDLLSQKYCNKLKKQETID